MKPAGKADGEYVLVFPTPLLYQVGYFQGQSLEPRKYLDAIIGQHSYSFMRRQDAEARSEWKQLIAYAILRHNGTVFTYRRGKGHSEGRLVGEYSIGLGGHISIEPSLFEAPYQEAIRRELIEEVEIDSSYASEIVGVINDDSSEVGRVHFGVVYLLTLEQPSVKPKEKPIHDSEFLSIATLKREIARFENWSRICIGRIDEILATSDSAHSGSGRV